MFSKPKKAAKSPGSHVHTMQKLASLCSPWKAEKPGPSTCLCSRTCRSFRVSPRSIRAGREPPGSSLSWSSTATLPTETEQALRTPEDQAGWGTERLPGRCFLKAFLLQSRGGSRRSGSVPEAHKHDSLLISAKRVPWDSSSRNTPSPLHSCPGFSCTFPFSLGSPHWGELHSDPKHFPCLHLTETWLPFPRRVALLPGGSWTAPSD